MMRRNLFLVILATTMIACVPPLVTDKPELNDGKTVVTSIDGLLIRNVTLQAREEKTIPPGATPDPSRDIGFATVFIRLENHTEANVKLTIEQIEIRNTSNGQVQLKMSSPQVIVLQSLEYSEEVFQLTNKIGYSSHNRVKAVITYQVGEQVDTIKSAPVEVER